MLFLLKLEYQKSFPAPQIPNPVYLWFFFFFFLSCFGFDQSCSYFVSSKFSLSSHCFPPVVLKRIPVSQHLSKAFEGAMFCLQPKSEKHVIDFCSKYTCVPLCAMGRCCAHWLVEKRAVSFPAHPLFLAQPLHATSCERFGSSLQFVTFFYPRKMTFVFL